MLPAGRQLTVDQVPCRSLPGGVEPPVFATSVPCDSGQRGVAGRAPLAALAAAPGTGLATRGQPRLDIEEPGVARLGVRAISPDSHGPSLAARFRAGFRFDSMLARSQPSSSPRIPGRERPCSLVGDEGQARGIRTLGR